LGYKDVERAASVTGNDYNGLDDMYKMFSRRHAEGMVARVRAEHQQHGPTLQQQQQHRQQM
jgi:hypothetical protein